MANFRGSTSPRARHGAERARRTPATLAVAAGFAVVAIGVATATPSIAATSGPRDAARPAALKIGVRQLALGQRRAGTYYGDATSTIVNTGSQPVRINRIVYSSGDTADFVAGTDCMPHGPGSMLPAHGTCVIKAVFTPQTSGARSATISIGDSASTSAQPLTLRGVGSEGYYITGPNGGVAHFGDAVAHGNRNGRPLNRPVIAMTVTTNGAGYWLLASDGGIFSFGSARFFGSTGAMHLNRPVVGMASDRVNDGYWLVASDGGIFAFGHAGFYGSTGSRHLNQPIIGMASTRSGHGYWLVARDGGIFSFGDAHFYGSVGASVRHHPIVGMTVTPTGHGYWLVTDNGRVFAFGDARVHGADGTRDIGTVVGIARTADGRGFWLLNSQAHVVPFGDARFLGDLHRSGLSRVVGIAATAPGVGSRRSTGIVSAPGLGALETRLRTLAAARAIRLRPS